MQGGSRVLRLDEKSWVTRHGTRWGTRELGRQEKLCWLEKMDHLTQAIYNMLKLEML